MTGAGIEAGGAAVLGTGGDIAIEALALERRFEDVYSRGYSRSESIDHILSRLRAGGALSVEAGGDLALRGAGLSAGGDAALTAGGAVTVASVQDSYNEDFKLSTGGGLFGGSSKIRDQKAGVETRRTTVTAGGALTVRAGAGDLVLDAVSLESGGETALEAEQGKVALLTETDSTFERDYVRREGLVRWKEKDKGHYKEEIEHVEVEAGGGLRIVAGEGVVVEYRKTDSLGASLDRLAQSPGLAWVEQLRGDPGVDWVAVEAAFEEWDYEASGLTQAGAALVTLAAVAVSAGTLSTVSASLAGSLGVGSAAAQAALTAGLTSLTSQAAVALVNHGGDLGAVLKQLGSSAALKSLATAMIAAGLTVELTGFAGLDKALPEKAVLADRVAHSLQQNLIRSTVRTAVSTAIQGGKLDDALVAGWTGAMISSALSGIQHEIGDFGVEHGLPEGSIQKILAHAMAGGLASELSGGAFADGALAGALAEITGPLLGGTGLDEETQVALQRLIGTTAVLLRGSEAGEAMFAGDIAASAHRNNYLSHDEAVERARSRQRLDECRAAAGACTEEEMVSLQGAITLLDTLDESRDLQYAAICATEGSFQCLKARFDYTQTRATYAEVHQRLGDADYLAAYGDILDDVQEEFNSGKAIDRLAMLAGVERGEEFTLYQLKALGLGAGAGAAAATAVFGGKAIAACIANPLCRSEVGAAIAEAAAGDALGGASLVPVVVGGKIAMTKGDEVVGFIDEATGSFKRAADVAYDAHAVREAAAKAREFKATATIGGKTCVYDCVVDGVTRYVGITDDVWRRGLEHQRLNNINIKEIRGLSGLSRADARAAEQALIHYHGLGKNGGTLVNRINSISPTRNPTAYELSLKRGFDILREVGYKGFE